MNEPCGGDTAVGSPGAPALLNAKVKMKAKARCYFWPKTWRRRATIAGRLAKDSTVTGSELAKTVP